jgi:hypothetical protein
MAELGRCAEHLYKTVEYMAVSSGTPKEKLEGISYDKRAAGFCSMAADQFPGGPLREKYQAIKLNVATDDEARTVIEQICELSDDVARALGGQK